MSHSVEAGSRRPGGDDAVLGVSREQPRAMGAGGPRARAIETAGRWFGPLAQRKPRPDRDKAFAEIRRAWHFIDAKGEILGRLAAKIAPLLCGKHKPIFQPARDVGDYVVVTNVEQIEVTGKNRQHKLYYRHSGYPGGLKALTFDLKIY